MDEANNTHCMNDVGSDKRHLLHQGGVRLFIYKRNIYEQLLKVSKTLVMESRRRPHVENWWKSYITFSGASLMLTSAEGGGKIPLMFFFSHLSAWIFIGTDLKPLSKECMLKYIAKLCLHACAFLRENVLIPVPKVCMVEIIFVCMQLPLQGCV